MMTVSEIKNVLLRVVRSNSLLGQISEIVKDKHAPVEEGGVPERIVVVVPGGADNGQLSRSYPRVCVYVPYEKFTSATTYYRPDNRRITELEKECVAMFRSGVYGMEGEDVYLYKLEDIVIEDDTDTSSNFLNVRLKFEVVNTKL